MEKVQQSRFYGEYYGHQLKDLDVVHSYFRKNNHSLIFLAGDSSLDNKFWFSDKAPAINGYENVLLPPVSKQDIAYCMNVDIVERNLPIRLAVVNCAVEESTVESRCYNSLLPQDHFLQENLRSDDIVVVSVGGNDIALRPTCCTILNTLNLICGTTQYCVNNCSCGCSIQSEGFCFGFLSNFCSCPPGMGYFVHLFSTKIKSYVNNLVSKTKPKLILICMIYYLDEKPGNSWAEPMLRLLGYNSNPAKLQSVIRQIFRLATKTIIIPGTRVVAVPLFEVLDGTVSSDYVQRVEPSASGGHKMAHFIIEKILTILEI